MNSVGEISLDLSFLSDYQSYFLFKDILDFCFFRIFANFRRKGSLDREISLWLHC